MTESQGDAPTSETRKRADELKQRANDFFKEKRFVEAVDLYTEAINLDPTCVAYYTNRAFAHLRLENYGSALQDANKAIEIDPKFIKGYYRRGSAQLALGRFKEGLKDFRAVVKIKPNDRDARAKLKACEKAVKKIAFEMAIQSEERVVEKLCETLDTATITVDANYEGPRIGDDGAVTLELVDEFVECFRSGEKIHRRYACEVAKRAFHIFKELETVVDITVPESNKLTVCGDVHGQFFDLLHIFELNGKPSASNPYLFNGDFVDRGSWSVEVILTLLSYKVACPECIYLTRGNHETLNMNKMYGFEGEVKAKYNDSLLRMLRETFQWLPLAYIIEKKAFVCHGGLFSKDGVTIDDLRKIKRCCEPPDEGLMTETLWSDPQPGFGRAPSKRGVGVMFGEDVTNNFLEVNNLRMIIRSHECKPEGFEVLHSGKCITVFSAPNYCDQMGNKGAFITFTKEMVPEFTTFSEVPHPDIRPMAYATNFPMSLMS